MENRLPNKQLRKPQLPNQSFEESPFLDVKNMKFKKKKVQSKLTYMKKSGKEKLRDLEECPSVAEPSENEVSRPSEVAELHGVSDEKCVPNPEPCADTCQRKMFLCPLCWKKSDNNGALITHMKSCASKNNLTIAQLLDAVELQEKQNNERKALGLPCVPLGPKKVNSRKITGARDPDLQLALALSASMQEAEVEQLLREQEVFCETGVSSEGTTTHMALLEKFGFTSTRSAEATSSVKTKQGARSRLRLQGEPPLLLRTEEERERLITEKVAIVLMGDEAEGAEAEVANGAPPAAPLQSPLLLQCEDKECKIWKLTGSLAESGTQEYYVDALGNAVLRPQQQDESPAPVSPHTTESCGLSASTQAGERSPERNTQRHADRSAELSAELSAERSAERSADCSADCSAERSVEHSVEYSAEHIQERSAERSAEHSAEHSAERGTELNAERIVELSAERIVELSAERIVELSAERIVELSAERSAERNAELGAERIQELRAEHSTERSSPLCKQALPVPSSQSLSRDWRKLLNNEVMSDVTVRVEDGRTIPAHRLVLFVRCPAVLKDLEDAEISGNRTKCVTWSVTYRSALAFLEFIYCGTCHRALSLKEGLDSVIFLANMYEVTDLNYNLHQVENVRKKLKAYHTDQSTTASKLSSTDVKLGLETPSRSCVEYSQRSISMSTSETENEKVEKAGKQCDLFHLSKRSPSPDPFGDVNETGDSKAQLATSGKASRPETAMDSAQGTPARHKMHRKRKSWVRTALIDRFVDEVQENRENVMATNTLHSLRQYGDSSKQADRTENNTDISASDELEVTLPNTSLICIKILSSDSEDEAEVLTKKRRTGEYRNSGLQATPPSRRPPSRTPPSRTPSSRTPPSRTPPSRTPSPRTPSPRTPSSRTPSSRTPPSRTPSPRIPPSRIPPSRTPSSRTPPSRIPPASTDTLASVKRLLEDSFLDSLGVNSIWPDGADVPGEVINTAFSPQKDNRFSLGNSVTPEQSSRTGTEITPMPDYSTMKTPALKKELQRYGLKPLKRKQAKLILRHIYNELHPWVMASAQKSASKHAAQADLEESPIMSLTQGSPLKSSKGNLSPQLKVDVVSDATANEQTSSGEGLHSAVQQLLASDAQLHESILLYQPLWLEQLHAGLSTNSSTGRHKPKLEQLIEYLDEQGITFRTEQKGSRTLSQRKKGACGPMASLD